MKRIRITFVGFEPFWMNHAAEQMNQRFGGEFDCRWMEWPTTLSGRARLVWATLMSDLVVRMGMPFEFQSESNWAWLLLCRLVPWVKPVNYWIGSDVMLFLRRQAAGELTERDLRASREIHQIAVTNHLTAELQAAGLDTRTAELMGTEDCIKGLAPMPDTFRVLGYWGAATFEHIGGPELYAAAEAMPDVEFDVLGTDGSTSPPAPPNITFLGRLEDPVPAYERCVVLVRQIQHDSVSSGMVEEMLLLGRYVIYTYDWPNTITIPYGDAAALIRELVALRERFDKGLLEPNVAGREFTLVDCDPKRRAESMHSAFLDIFAGRF